MSIFNIDHSIIAAAAFSNSGFADAVGIQAVGASTIDVNNSKFAIFSHSNTGNAVSNGVNSSNAGTTVTVNDSKLNIFARSELGNATATAFVAQSGSVINAMNNFGNIIAIAPHGTATASSADITGGGTVNETNDHFNIFPALKNMTLASNQIENYPFGEG